MNKENIYTVDDICGLLSISGSLDESGAGLSRIMVYIHSGKPFALITAFRSSYSDYDNRQANARLVNDLRAKDLGGLQVKGRWIDRVTDVPGEERSFFVTLPPENPHFKDVQSFGMHMARLGRKYAQQAVLFGDGEDVALLSFNKGVMARERIGASISINRESLEKAKEWSEIKKRKFIFEGVYLPDSFVSSLAASQLGLGDI